MNSDNNSLSKVSTKSRTSTSNESLIPNTEAKLRRLKIQENLLSNSLNKCYEQINDDNKEAHTATTDLNLKTYLVEIVNIYQEIKDTSRNKENLKDTDIKDIKMDVLKMEDKMKQLKTLLQKEITALRASELDLVAKIDEGSLAIAKKSTKIYIKPFSDVMPSPVRAIMYSPAKCKEVQEFQDYIAVHGRCGSWLDYNHNIFVKVWQKYFNDDKNMTKDYYDTTIVNSASFPKFMLEILHKVPGISNEEVMLHVEWYTIFLYLKQRQQLALNIWKQKRLVKKGYKKYVETSEQIQDKTLTRLLYQNSDDNELYQDLDNDDDYDFDVNGSKDSSQKSVKKSDKGSHKKESIKFTSFSLARIMRPTEQWNNKYFGSFDTNNVSDFGNVENVNKLGIPQWRLCLRN